MASRHFLLIGERICQFAGPMVAPLGRVERATTAADAVRILDEHRFSLLGFFADAELPDGTVFDVLERAWFLEIYVPGLVVTAHAGPYPNEEARAKAYPLGRRDANGAQYWGAAFLGYPFGIDNVQIQVERWEQRAADDQTEDELAVQRLARERNVDPAEIREHVEGIKAKTKGPSVAVVSRRLQETAMLRIRRKSKVKH